MSNSKIKSIASLKSLKNKTVLVRCDFDIPLENSNLKTQISKLNKIKDDSRLKACLPTINFLLKKQVKQIILIGHLGRPGGKVVPKLSLLPVAKHLEKLLNVILMTRERKNPVKNKLRIKFIKNINEILRRRSAPPQNDILLLENHRFNKGEETNDKNFAKKLASLADIYVNEAFAVSHRSAASINAIQNYLPSYAGLHLAQEINQLSQVIKKPAHPLVLIIGGAKIETKLPVIKQFINKADYILVGGAVATDFLKASGVAVGKSLVDEDYIEEAKKILKKSKIRSQILGTKFKIDSKIILPIDWKIKNNRILDIGPQTIKLFYDIIKRANTIIWNGPMGYFEDKKFAIGTKAIAKAIFKSKVRVVIGGGDTNQILTHNTSYIIHNTKVFISTGGGAMLEFLGNKKLPGLKKIFY